QNSLAENLIEGQAADVLMVRPRGGLHCVHRGRIGKRRVENTSQPLARHVTGAPCGGRSRTRGLKGPIELAEADLHGSAASRAASASSKLGSWPVRVQNQTTGAGRARQILSSAA